MNQNAVIGLIVAVVVIGGGAWYFSTHSSGTPAAPGTGGAAGGQQETGTLSFKELLALGGSQTCQVTVATASAPSTGTVYISGMDVRSDVVASANGTQVNAHMIKTGDTIYAWTDMAPQGVKMKFDASAQTSGHSSGAYDANAQVQYSCAPWVADASKFAVPSSVSFMDMTSAGMPGAMPVSGGAMPTPPPGYPNNY